ncbi:50S ribosomal protein L9 [Thalassoporum mexicanum PCC 7367]|uniref:50S ribosomal protein L9 n=1 Tax=Thalassoporum mexicanum TaxID=3457544 RepID=UPI00029FC738|nr:50S ribosomal protein L9 [Pseudanabaena sp. PCC 7367]AFY69507.1 50S ribosomal protein L9 [Pseudanabaena sp. PCC 7367]
MAKSNVQVMLTKNVNKLGKLGELVSVAPGYAQNYLLPRGLAVRATSGVIKEVERRLEEERQRQIAIKKEAQDRKVALTTIGGFIIKKQVGEGKSIFGTVTDREVAQLIVDKTTMEIDRRDIEVPDVRETGDYEVKIKLHPEVTAILKLEVLPE